MKKYTEGTNYSPDWESRVERFFTGIGGSTRCIGVRKLYVGLETTDDHRIPGELCSTEIAGSDAPMLLSLQSQEALGLVVDFVDGTVRSKTLGCTFKAVRGRRNRLIGLKLHPGSFMDSVDEYWVSMMAAEGGAPSDGTTPPPALTPHEPPPRMTQEVRRVPVRGRPYEKRELRGHESDSRSEEHTKKRRAWREHTISGSKLKPWRRSGLELRKRPRKDATASRRRRGG